MASVSSIRLLPTLSQNSMSLGVDTLKKIQCPDPSTFSSTSATYNATSLSLSSRASEISRCVGFLTLLMVKSIS